MSKLSLARIIALISVMAIGVFFSRLYEPSLSGDALKYALIAKTMLKEGNYLLPHLGDEPYYKKPPLFFWIMALSFNVFGFNEFAARFPSALFACFSSLVLFLLIYEITKNKTISFLSALVFMLNFEVIRISTVVRFESFILFINLVAILLLSKRNFLTSLIAGLLSGAAVLVKGPLGILGLTSVFLYSLFSKKREFLIYSLISLLVAFLLSSIYYIYAYKEYPDFIKEFVSNQILGRINGTLKEGTPRSFFFYERLILKHFWPWNFFLIISFVLLLRRKVSLFSYISNKDLFFIFLTFFFLTFIPLHFISLKFSRYSYYVYPILSFVVALAAFSLKWEKRVILLSGVIFSTYLLAAAVCPCKFHKDKFKNLRYFTYISQGIVGKLNISKSFPEMEKYFLLFYFNCWDKNSPYVISKSCQNPILSFKNYCIDKVKK